MPNPVSTGVSPKINSRLTRRCWQATISRSPKWDGSIASTTTYFQFRPDEDPNLVRNALREGLRCAAAIPRIGDGRVACDPTKEQWRARPEIDHKPPASQLGCSDTLIFDLSRIYAQR